MEIVALFAIVISSLLVVSVTFLYILRLHQASHKIRRDLTKIVDDYVSDADGGGKWGQDPPGQGSDRVGLDT